MSLHLPDNIKLVRKLYNQTQPEFIANFTGISVAMQKSYESGKASPGSLYIEELSELSGVSEKDLRSKKLGKGDVKKVEKETKTANPSNIDLLAADKQKEFRGLIFARISAIEANLRVLNNKFAEINSKVTGEPITKTLTELEQTTRQVAKMLQEELQKMFP